MKNNIYLKRDHRTINVVKNLQFFSEISEGYIRKIKMNGKDQLLLNCIVQLLLQFEKWNSLYALLKIEHVALRDQFKKQEQLWASYDHCGVKYLYIPLGPSNNMAILFYCNTFSTLDPYKESERIRFIEMFNAFQISMLVLD